MSIVLESIELAFSEVEIALKKISKIDSNQIKQADLKDYLKSVAFSWFQSHRPSISAALAANSTDTVDTHLQRVLDATGRASAKNTYVTELKGAKVAIAGLRSEALTAPSSAQATDDSPPDFSPLASDLQMREILTRRWKECLRCMTADAHLAATVMMGGLLEALFVARANQLGDKSPLFKAKATPIDSKSQKPLPLKDWTLRPYIDVGRELGWISKSGKDVAEVLRDYRNYIHPEKERSHGVTLGSQDSEMFWLVTKILAKQLLNP